MLRSLYDSVWQFPWGILLLQIPVLFWVLLRARSTSSRWLKIAAVAGMVTIVADDLTKHSAITGGLATALSIGFVIAGDWRFVAVLERFGHRRRPSVVRWVGLALVPSLLVPLGAWLIVQKSAAIAEMRVLFVVHEAMFTMLAIGMLLVTSARDDLEAATKRWLTLVCAFEITQYGLWVAADVIIMLGHDAGFGIRVIPNVLYYVAFVPFVLFTAPEDP